MSLSLGGALLAPRYLGWLIDGFLVTLTLSALVSAAALLIGFALCMARLSPLVPLRWGATAWISLFRNTPLLVQLFLWYFGVSSLLPTGLLDAINARPFLAGEAFGLRLPAFELIAGFIGLTLFTAAFMAEEFRAGLAAVPPGQRMAARAMGLTEGQIWQRILLPQAWRNALSPLAGQVMNAVKNSSLLMAIGAAELSYEARRVETETFQAFQTFAIATALYIGLILAIEAAARRIEQRTAVLR